MLTAFGLAGFLVAASPAAHQSRLVVLPLSAQRVPPEVVAVLDHLLLNEVAAAGRYSVVGASDIEAMLGFERLKDATGCDDVSCAAEIGGALGASRLLAVNAGVLGERLVLTAKLVDVANSEIAARSTVEIANAESEYATGLKKLVEKLLETASGAEVPVEHFVRAGLTPNDHKAFVASTLHYEMWVAVRNRESLALDVARWGSTALAAVLGAGLLLTETGVTSDSGDHWAVGTLMVALPCAALWGLDLLDIGAVPESIGSTPVAAAE